MIKVAAERQGLNVTELIIRSACEKAKQSLADQTASSWMRSSGEPLWQRLTGRPKPSRASASHSKSGKSPSADHERRRETLVLQQ